MQVLGGDEQRIVSGHLLDQIDTRLDDRVAEILAAARLARDRGRAARPGGRRRPTPGGDGVEQPVGERRRAGAPPRRRHLDHARSRPGGPGPSLPAARWVLPIPASPSTSSTRPTPGRRRRHHLRHRRQLGDPPDRRRPSCSCARCPRPPTDATAPRTPSAGSGPDRRTGSPEHVPTSWRTTSDTSTSPPAARPAIRAAALTAAPSGSASASTHLTGVDPEPHPRRRPGQRPLRRQRERHRLTGRRERQQQPVTQSTSPRSRHRPRPAPAPRRAGRRPTPAPPRRQPEPAARRTLDIDEHHRRQPHRRRAIDHQTTVGTRSPGHDPRNPGSLHHLNRFAGISVRRRMRRATCASDDMRVRVTGCFRRSLLGLLAVAVGACSDGTEISSGPPEAPPAATIGLVSTSNTTTIGVDSTTAALPASSAAAGVTASTTTTPVKLPTLAAVHDALDSWRQANEVPGVIVAVRLGTAQPLIVASGTDPRPGKRSRRTSLRHRQHHQDLRRRARPRPHRSPTALPRRHR